MAKKAAAAKAKKGESKRTPVKKWTKEETDKFVAKYAKDHDLKPGEATVKLLGYAANRLLTLDRNRKTA